MDDGPRPPGRAPLAWAAAGAVAGALLGDLPVPGWAWALTGALALAAVAWQARGGRTVRLGPLLLVAAAAVGALRERQAVAACRRDARAAALAAGAVATVRGEVLDRMEETAGRTGGIRRTRWRLSLPGDGGLLTATLGGDAPGRPGERVEVTGLFRPPRPPGNPGGFDGEAWALHEGLLGTLVVGGPEGVRVLGEAPGPLARLRSLREALRRRLSGIFPGEDGDVLGALLLGVREPLDPELSDAFLETGTVHYLSISGTHVLIALGALAWLLRWTPLGPRSRAGLLAVAALGYAALVGMQAPVLRAALAAALAGSALLLGRPRAALNAVSAAALVIVLADPGQAFRAGFQLSFLAAGGILVLASPISERLEALARGPSGPVLGRARRYVLVGLAVSLAAWLPVLPLVAGTFHLVTPGVLLANLAVFPLVAGVMGAGALAMAFPACAGMAKALLGALAWTVEAFARLPGGHRYVASSPAWLTAAYYAWLGALAWRLAFPSAPRPSPRVLALGGGGLLVAALAWGARPTAPPCARVAMLDVQQGLCVLVQLADGGTLLYDCGAYGHPEAAARTMAPALWALGVRRIDTLVVSHAHADHFNGLPALARRFPVGRILTTRAALAAPSWAPAEVMRGGIPLAFAAAGDRLTLGAGAVAEVLHPAAPGQIAPAPNDASLCLRVRLAAVRARVRPWGRGPERVLPLASGEARILLTGDLGGEGAALLLASGREMACEVLLLPHHGGILGPLAPLLAAAGPAEAWISAREGFPSPSTLAGLEAFGARSRETWREGAVILEALP